MLAFKQGVYQLSQQRESRLASLCRNESFVGKAESFDRLDVATAQAKTTRNSETPNLNITATRRWVSTVMYEWATLVDRKDKLQNIQDPENEYAKAAQAALGRQMDTVIIAAALGSAAGGEGNTTTTALGTAQKVVPVSAGAQAKMNTSALRRTKYLLDKAEAVGPRYFVINSDSLEALLNETQVTSADFNTVRALVQGEIDTFMGFKFIRLELLGINTASAAFSFDVSSGLVAGSGSNATINASSVSNFAFVGDGIIFGKTDESMARITEESTKSFSHQVYASMDFGAVRMEEVKVVEVICLPA